MLGQQNNNIRFFADQGVSQEGGMLEQLQIHAQGPDLESFDLKQNLSLAHLTRSDIQMLLYKRGLEVKGSDEQLQEKLAEHLLQNLDIQWSAGMLGICTPCRENAIVVNHKNGLYVWGGRVERTWDHISEFEAFPQDGMWRYDLVQGYWAQIGAFPMNRRLGSDRTGHSAVVCDDKIWIFGGLSGNQSTYFSELITFDTVKKEWELQVSMPMAGGALIAPRGWHQAVVYKDNMIVYGHNGDCRQQAENPESIFVYNFTNRVWSMERCSIRGGRTTERPFHDGVLAMTTMNGKIYVLSCDLRAQGGNGGNNLQYVQEQLLPPFILLPQHLENQPNAQNQFHNQLPNYGGQQANVAAAASQQLEIHELDFETKTWKKIVPHIRGRAPASRFGCAAVHIGDVWLIHGGLLADHTVSKQVFTYNFVRNEWSCQDELTETLMPRVSHKAIAVRDSVWLMMGTGQYNGNAQQLGGLRAGGAPFNYFDMLQGAPYVKQIDCIWLKAQAATQSKDMHIINTDVERGLQQLQTSDELSDLLLKCTDGEFRAHRAVLAANSEIFRAMFQHGMMETQDQCVHIEDANSSTVKIMLSYMYGDMTSGQMLTTDLLVPTFKLSDKYHITGLRHACLKRIMQSLNLDEVCSYVQLASAHHCEQLYEACVKAAGQNKEAIKCVLQSAGYLQLMQEEPELVQKFMVDVVSRSASQTNDNENQDQEILPLQEDNTFDNLIQMQ